MIELKFEPIVLDAFFDETALIDAADAAAREVMRRRGLRRGANLLGATEAANEAAQDEMQKQTRAGKAGFRRSK